MSMPREKCLDLFSKTLRGTMMYEQCSLTELSNATGISKGVLSRYMNGKEVPNPMHVAKIANELAVSFDDLVDLGDCFD